jgi:hypothetical protein
MLGRCLTLGLRRRAGQQQFAERFPDIVERSQGRWRAPGGVTYRAAPFSDRT